MELAQTKLKEDLQEALLDWDENRQGRNALSLETILQAHPGLNHSLPRAIAELKEMDWLLSPDGDEQQEQQQAESAPSRIQAGPSGLPGYTLIEKLGKGGFGEVWKATGPGGLPVALKIIPMDRGLESVELRSLELFKSIRHPHLLSMFGSWISQGHLWIAMELAERDFLDYVGSQSPNLETLLSMFEDAAEAIDFLNQKQHSQGDGEKVAILHRDIQPRNMLIVGGCLKIGDFGLARVLEEEANDHSGCMTPSYAAPEFFHGSMSPTSDQYSLAVSYCKLRGGQVPFTGSPAEVMAGHCHKVPDLSMLPPQEREVVAIALAKNPAKRWKHCTEFISELKQAARQPAKPTAKKFPLTRYATVAVTLTVLAAIFFGTGGRQEFQVTMLSGHTEGVLGVAISKDGKIGLSGSADHRVIAWDLDKKVPLWSKVYHKDTVRSVAISQDNQFALTGGELGYPRILFWNLKTGEMIRELIGHDHKVTSIRFLPDGKRAVSCSLDCTARMWDVETGSELFRFKGLDTYSPNNMTVGSPRQIWNLDVSDDGLTMVCGLRNGNIKVFDIASGEEIKTLVGPDYVTRSFSMDGPASQCVTAYGGTSNGLKRPFDPRVIHWDIGQQTKKVLEENPLETDCLHLTRDGRKLFRFSAQGPPVLFDMDTGKKTPVLEELAGKVFCVAGSESGQRLLLGCKEGMVRLMEKVPR